MKPSELKAVLIELAAIQLARGDANMAEALEKLARLFDVDGRHKIASIVQEIRSIPIPRQ